MSDEPIKAQPAGQVYSLAELFARDPRENTDDDVRAIIAALRESRQKFIRDGDQKAGGPPKLTAAEQKVKGLSLDIKL